jgi:ABC-type transporter Mla subunit MlaD
MQLKLGSEVERLEGHNNDFKKNIQKTGKLNNQQLTSLLNESLQTIEEQDEEIIQLTGERDAYKEGFEESQEDIKSLNSQLDKYEDRQIDDNTITRLNHVMNNRPDRFNEIRLKKMEQVKQKTLEVINKRREFSRRLGNNK